MYKRKTLLNQESFSPLSFLFNIHFFFSLYFSFRFFPVSLNLRNWAILVWFLSQFKVELPCYVLRYITPEFSQITSAKASNGFKYMFWLKCLGEHLGSSNHQIKIAEGWFLQVTYLRIHRISTLSLLKYVWDAAFYFR